MKNCKTVYKNICIVICLLAATILLLQVLRIYYRLEDENTIGSIEKSAYDIEAGENSLSFAQMVQAIDSEETIVLEQNGKDLYYSETEFNEYSDKLKYQIRQLVVEPWRGFILEALMNSKEVEIYGREVQFFYEVDNKIYTFQLVGLNFTSRNGMACILFEKDSCAIFSIECHTALETSSFNLKYYAGDYYSEQENYIKEYYDKLIDYKTIYWVGDPYTFTLSTMENNDFTFNKGYENIIIEAESY